MKKILALILAMLVAVTFVACKKDEVKKPSENEINTEEEIVEEIEDEVEGKVEEDKKSEETKQENAPSSNKEDVKNEEVKQEENKPAESKPEQKPAESKPEQKPAETPVVTEKTLGNTLLAEFKTQAKSGKSADEIANSLLNNPAILFSGATNPVAPGDYLPGFDNEGIKGFKSGVAFMPMIGSIPFVGYVFELDGTVGASEFISTLKSSANLRWLICAEAEEMVAGSEGNKVFFVMCPKSLEE